MSPVFHRHWHHFQTTGSASRKLKEMLLPIDFFVGYDVWKNIPDVTFYLLDILQGDHQTSCAQILMMSKYTLGIISLINLMKGFYQMSPSFWEIGLKFQLIYETLISKAKHVTPWRRRCVRALREACSRFECSFFIFFLFY